MQYKIVEKKGEPEKPTMPPFREQPIGTAVHIKRLDTICPLVRTRLGCVDSDFCDYNNDDSSLDETDYTLIEVEIVPV